MDLNIETTFIKNDQKNNQMLFNAIKNKLDGTENATASPPKFNIPLLKIPNDDTLGSKKTVEHDKSPTQLNNFLIKKLQEKHSNNNLSKKSSEFVLPQLASPAQNNITAKYEFPAFQSPTGHSNIGSLTTAINKLRVQENSSKDAGKSLPATIDLRTALATKFETLQRTPTKGLMKPLQSNAEFEFKIPFIDCDRQDISTGQKLLPSASNEYCVKDVSQLFLQHSLAEPSAVGRFLNSDDKKYSDPPPLKYFTSQFRQRQVKHCIEPFRFDTQSPDDVVLLALSKYQRRHHN